MILAFDTATKYCSVALEIEGSIDCMRDKSENGHAKTLLVLIDKILKKHDVTMNHLDGIVVSLGPGSFTGLRIGIATALGFKSALGIPVYGVSSLEARSKFLGTTRVPLIDARRNRVYAASYGEVELPPQNCSFPELLEKLPKDVTFSGESIEAFMEQVSGSFLEVPFYDYAKGAILCYQDGHYTEDLTPIYLREAEAQAKLDGIQLE
ncbi:tRNA (adenosine(37)-N6)-threonylcarbamoyltransferase complex dimerization subunit type 1 TsaB [Guggenheimella bovis]